MKVLRRSILAVFVLLVLIQFVPVNRTNPPVTGDIVAPDLVREVLRSSCYDCHSYETRWPWYSRVAPVSWILARHVAEGREHLNFSEWEALSLDDKDEARGDIWDEVEEGAMPLWDYVKMHPEAVLTETQMDALRRWSQGEPQEFPDWD